MKNLKETKLATTEKNKFVVVSIYYALGGMNYFTGTEEPRGYWMSATPTEFEETQYTDSNGQPYTMVSRKFLGFSGNKVLLLRVPRKSAKSEREAISLSGNYQDALVKVVLAKNGLQLATTEAPRGDNQQVEVAK